MMITPNRLREIIQGGESLTVEFKSEERLTGLSEEQTRYRLRKLTRQGRLEAVGAGRGAYYRLPQMEKNGE